MVNIKARRSDGLPLLSGASSIPNKDKRVMLYAFAAAFVLGLFYFSPDGSSAQQQQQQQQQQVPNFSTTPRVHHSSKDELFKQRDLTDYHDLCIVGAGLSGAVIAERFANERGQTSLIMERREHIGGNCFDYIDEETGIRVSKYGAHLFHTYYERVWEYVQKWSDWTPYEHEVVALINGKHVPVPVNIDTVNALFDLNIQNSNEMDEWLAKEQVPPPSGEAQNSEEMAKSRVGSRLYELIFHPYTIKQWAKEPRDLGPEVTARIPVRNNHDPRYFADPHQALPSNGYTAIFEKIFENPLITVKTNTDFFEIRDQLKCGKLYYTGQVDRYFADQGLEKLEYRSLDFERQVVKDTEFYQPRGVVNHPNASDDFTRIVEYKHFLNQESKDTILFYEHSKDGGEPYYPVPNPTNKDLFARYKSMADAEIGVSFVGRLANYKYFNMDQTIENALELFDTDTGSLDIVIERCEGDTSSYADLIKGLQPTATYIYNTCKAEPVEIEGAQYFQLSNQNAADFHMKRNDIDFASQTLFLKDTTLTLTDLQVALLETAHQSHFVDFATLPFLGCQTSQCDRDITLETGKEFLASREAIRRFTLNNPSSTR